MAVAPLKEMTKADPTEWFDAFIKQVGGGGSVTQTTNTSASAAANIESLLASATANATGDAYSKDSAFKDSDAILAQIFRDFKEQSLPQIYQAQANSGGYNSATGQMLANDAFARAVSQGQAAKLKAASDYGQVQAGQVNAAVNAGRTAQQVNARSVQTQKMNPAATLLSAGSLAAKAAPFLFSRGSKAVELLKKKKEADLLQSQYEADDLINGPGGGNPYESVSFGSSDVGAGIGGTNAVGGSTDFANVSGIEVFGSDIGGGDAGDFASIAESGSLALDGGDFAIDAASFGGEFGDQGGAILDSGGTFVDAGASFADAGSFGIDAASFGGEFGDQGFDLATAGTDFATGGIPVVGPLINIAEGDYGAAAGGVIGGFVGGPIGSFVGATVGGFADDSVVCTFLLRRGLISREAYDADIKYAKEHLSPTILRGYRWWAIPLVRLMKEKGDQSFLIRGAQFVASRRIKHITSGECFSGALIRFLFEPLCYVIGTFVPVQQDQQEMSKLRAELS